MKTLWLLLLLTFFTPAVLSADNETVYFGGPIITMEPAQPSVEAVVTKGTRIQFVGTLADARQRHPDASPHDLKGQTLMPGFIEQHLHPILGALALSVPVIAPEAWELPDRTWPAVTAQFDYLAALKTAEIEMTDPDATLWTWGYHHLYHGRLNRTMLDGISRTRPIGVWHRSAHEFYANTALLEKYGLTEQALAAAPSDAQAQTDLDKGHFYENGALVFFLPRVIEDLASEARFRAGLNAMVTMLHRNGVTAYNEPGALVVPAIADLYTEILAADSTPMYSFFTAESKSPYLKHGAGPELVAAVEAQTRLLPRTGKVRYFEKQVKILFDGAIISQLMQMKDGYLDGHKGEWIQDPEQTRAIIETFWDQDYQILVHTNGDLGLETLLSILEAQQKRRPRKDHRLTVVHFANATPEQVKRIAELGAIVSANPYYLTGFGNKYAEVGLGPERAHAMVRLAEVVEAGIPLSLHSDLPMAPADPLFLVWCAVNRQTNEGNVLRPDLAISLDDALRGITIDAAHSWRMEQQLGSIKAGKVANFTLLDQNPYEVPARQLNRIDVTGTVFEGRWFPVQ
ncbi:amidohydrolase [Halomonas denitrificans]|nr:amidohydrolase [Halomonas denitrificans]